GRPARAAAPPPRRRPHREWPEPRRERPRRARPELRRDRAPRPAPREGRRDGDPVREPLPRRRRAQADGRLPPPPSPPRSRRRLRVKARPHGAGERPCPRRRRDLRPRQKLGGPKGGPGMPEWGQLPIPEKLLRRGVKDLVRISDARMSGTSYGTCVLHVSP